MWYILFMQPGDEAYDPRDYPPVAVTVDVVVQTIQRGDLYVLLIERGQAPHCDEWALPGGFVQPDEDLYAAAARELNEETGLSSNEVHLEQLASYGSPDRDPRMRVVTIAYWAICSHVPKLAGGGDARSAQLVPVGKIEGGDIELAFDHGLIVRDALERTRSKLEYTALAAKFCEPNFTISDLRKVYETVWQTTLDPGNFQRSVRTCGAFKEVNAASTDEESPIAYFSLPSDHNPKVSDAAGGRPASLWCLNHNADMAILRTLIVRRPRRNTNSE